MLGFSDAALIMTLIVKKLVLELYRSFDDAFVCDVTMKFIAFAATSLQYREHCFTCLMFSDDYRVLFELILLLKSKNAKKPVSTLRGNH